MMSIFNTREIAIFIWLIFFCAFFLRHKKVRSSLKNVLIILFQSTFVIIFLIVLLYTELVVFILAKLNYWDFSFLKDTFIWFMVTGLVICFRAIGANKDEHYFRRILIDNLKILVIIEFIVNTQTFHILIELIIFPFLLFFGLIEVFTETDNKYAQVSKFASTITAISGFILLAFIIRSVILNFESFGTIETLKTFFLPFILTICILPLAFVIMIYSKYETLFVRLKLGNEKSKKLKRFVKWKMFLYCGLNQGKIHHVLKTDVFGLSRVQNKKEVRDLINEYKVKYRN